MLNLIRLSWYYAKDARSRMVLFYVLCIISNIIIAVQPLVLAEIINSLSFADATSWQEFIKWSILLWLVMLGFWSFHGPARLIERKVAFTIYKNYVSTLYQNIMSMPLKWHQAHHSGDTLGRVSKSSKALFLFSQNQFEHIQIVTRYVASILFLGWLCWWLALIVFSLSVLLFIVIRKLDKKFIKLINLKNEREHRLSAALYDYVGNIVSILTLRLGLRTGQEIDHRFATMKNPFYELITYQEKKWFIIDMSISFMRAAMIALYIIVILQMDGVLVVGTVVAIFQYLGTINSSCTNGTAYAGALLQHDSDVRSVDGLEADYAALTIKEKIKGPDSFNHIEIKNLTFTHIDGEDEFHHIKDITFDICSGQKIALVGASGSGKTTLLTLLRGLYEAKKVHLSVDGEPFENLSPLSGFTTLITQDTEIFENTIRYNLTMGLDVSDNKLNDLIEMVGLSDFIKTLPQGLETDIRERGVNLSGGQKQRLSLARGLLAGCDSNLLLLDEPTSHVDLKAEEKIFTAFMNVFADKAIIASLHRLHLLPYFDWIIVMEEGRIIQQGSFDDLIKTSGYLQTLWQNHVKVGP